jgi:hypothetical protein
MLAVGLVVAASCSPSAAGSGQDMGPTIRNPALFSYQAPKGWSSTLAADGFPQAVGTQSNNFTPDITFATNGYAKIDAFAKTYQPHLVDVSYAFPLKLVDEKPFVTAKGLKGMRLHSIDPASPPLAEQFSYVFNNKDGLVMELACACAPADAAHYAPIFDASMKTVLMLDPSGY